MKPGELTVRRFERLEPMDEDGSVWLVRDRLQPSWVGVCKYGKGRAELEALDRERNHLLELAHPALRTLRGAGRTKRGEGVMSLEYVEGDRLTTHLAAHPSDATRCAEELLRALLYLHERGRVHGDLKPDNVLVDTTGRLRLIDLGLAAAVGTPPLGGTRPFLAPEYERGEPLSVAGDLYALGRTLREAASAHLDSGTPQLGVLVDACCAVQPTDRPASAGAALAQLGSSPWPLDRLGQLPSMELGEVQRVCQGALDQLRGAVVVVRGGAGSGRSRLFGDLRRAAIRRGRSLVDGTLAGGNDPLSLLRSVLNPGIGTHERSLEEVVGEALAATAREGVGVVLDDVDQVSEDLRHALVPGVRTLTALATGGLILLGVDEALSDDLAAAGAQVVRLPSWSEAQVRRAFELAGVRGGPDVAAALHRGSEGRAGVVGHMVETLLAHPDLGPPEVERRSRELWHHGEPKRLEPADLDEALVLAGRAVEQRAGRSAVKLLRAALPDLDDSPRDNPDAAMLLARAEALSGNLDLAAELFGALDQRTQPRARYERAKLLERLGRFEEVRGEAWQLIAEKEVGPGSAMVVATAALASGEIEEARSAVDAGLLVATSPSDRGHLRLIASDIALREGSAVEALSLARKSLEILESGGGEVDPRLLASAWSRVASAYSLSGDPVRAREGHAAALEAAENAGDVAGLVPYVLNLATADHALGELASAIARYEEAARLAERLGRTANRAGALVNLAGLLATVGAVGDAEKVLADAQEAAIASGSAIYRAQTTLIGAEIAGRVDADSGRALARGASQEFIACGAGRQALEAELLEAELCDDRASRRAAQRWLSEHSIQLKEAGLEGRSLLLGARIALDSDDLDEARTRAELCVKVVEEASDRELEASALSILASAHERLGTGGEEPLRARARESLAAVAARLPPGLRERYLSDPARSAIVRSTRDREGAPRRGLSPDARRLLALVRRVLLEGDERRVLEAAVDEAVELTRAERAFLLRLGSGKGGAGEVVVARNLDGESIRRKRGGFSRSVADEVISTGEPVVTALATEDPRLRGARSILDLGLRSILCVPIRGPSGIMGALYLDHRFHEGRFGDTEREVVQALTDVIGLALENARLHKETFERAEALDRAHQAVLRENLLRAAELERMSDRLARVTAGEETCDEEGGIVGRSAALRQALDLARRVSPSDLPVLIEGESGTGKELLARFVHDSSLRGADLFLAINCGAIPEALLESELFGHVRGAFTGATHDHAGLLRSAEGGTVLLDEIGEMPLRMQTRLLRVLQEHTVRPVGASEDVKVDVRIVAATNRDLEADVAARRFRKDLFYRLVGVRITMPPLRERLDDIPLLARALLTRIAREPGMREVKIGRDALALLLEHDWPGNVRELEQALRRAVLVAEGEKIGAADLGLAATRTTRTIALKRFDRELVRQALAASGGNRSAAARALGVSRVTVHRWINRYGL